jgi:hypothetical protein
MPDVLTALRATADIEAYLMKRASELREGNESLAQSFSKSFTGLKPRDPVGQKLFHLSNQLAGLTTAKQAEVAKAMLPE